MAMAPERKVEAAENARSTWPVGPTLTGPEGWFGGLTVLSPAPRSARGFGDMGEEDEEKDEEVEVVQLKSCSRPMPRVSSLAAAWGPVWVVNFGGLLLYVRLQLRNFDCYATP